MSTVFVVMHEYETSFSDEFKFIGVDSSEEEADAAVTRLRELPGFRDFPDGFHVSECSLNEDNWVEGFSRMCGLLVPTNKQGSYLGAMCALTSGGYYEICSIDDSSVLAPAFESGQIVRATEKSVDGRVELVAVEAVENEI